MQYPSGIKDNVESTKKIKLCKKCPKPRYANLSFCYGDWKTREREKRAKKKEAALLRKARFKERKANSISKLIKQADNLFSLAIRKRDGKCRRTGSTQNLQCSHIYSRSNKFIRWDMDNAFTLTAGQHLYWWHKEPAEAVEWAKQELGDEKWDELRRKKNTQFKLTAEFIKERISFLKDYLSK